MDPFDRLNRPIISQEERREMAWDLYKQYLGEKRYQTYKREDLIANVFKRVDEFLNVYLEEYSK